MNWYCVNECGAHMFVCMYVCVCVYVCVYMNAYVWFGSVQCCIRGRPRGQICLASASVRGHVYVQSLHGRWSYPLTSALEVQSLDTTLLLFHINAVILRGSIVWSITTGNYQTVILKCRGINQIHLNPPNMKINILSAPQILHKVNSKMGIVTMIK